MARIIQISRMVVAFSVLIFCHHVRCAENTTDTNNVQNPENLSHLILKQLLSNNNMHTIFVSLMKGRTMNLESNFKDLSKKIDSKGGGEFQKLTLQLEDIEKIARMLNDKFDNIENDLDIIKANVNVPTPENKWKNFGGIYYFFSNEAATWDDAKTKCEAINSKSSLVTIGSKQINDFLIRNGKNDAYWTGGNDKQQEGVWVWVETGNALTYRDWRSGEPNNFYGNEDCMVLYTSSPRGRKHWNDIKCGSFNRYICQTSSTPSI